MKYVFMLLILGGSGYWYYQQQQAAKARAAAKAVEPPPELTQPVRVAPAPVLSDPEQAKILKATQDTDPAVRWEAIKLLYKVRHPKAAQVVAEHLRRDFEMSVRRDILKMLMEESKRHGERAATHEELLALKQETTELLLIALKDNEPDVRIDALIAIAAAASPSASPSVSAALQDADERVRLQALKSLNALQSRSESEAREEQDRLEKERQRKLEEFRSMQEQGKVPGRTP